MSDIRHASIEPGPPEPLPSAIAQAGPFAILLLAALWLHRRFDQLPARIPIHWNWRGEANGFVPRSGWGVALPLLLGAGICLSMLAMQVGLRRSSPRSGMRAAAVKLILAGEYFGALLCCGALAASVSGGRLAGPVLALAVVLTLALVAYSFQVARRMPKEPLRNPSAWRAGVFYVDRADPALFVPKRFGAGYTLNFGHPMAVVLLLALLLIPLIAVFVGLSAR